MEIYRKLGVRPRINCATTYTRFGGSIMHPSVAQAMADSAGAFVNLWDLQDAVGNRLAELTNNEAAYVSNGAAAGLALSTAACITGTDLALMARLPSRLDGLKNEVVVHRTQRNWYDIAVRQTGVKLVEIGHIMETFPWELDDAINERTAAVLYFAGTHLNRNTLPLEYVIERAHAREVPVIVDAAAQVPPVENLWHFTRDLGADIAIFSGGKNLAGPQNSGLVVGRKAIIEAMKLNGPPHQRIGRSMKVSKEAMIGLLTAVERYLNQDHAAIEAEWDRVVNAWLDAWQAIEQNAAIVVRDDFNEAGERIPRVIVSLTPMAGIDRAKLLALLTEDDPPIEVVLHDDHSVAFSPHLLQPGEAEVVERRVAAILAGLRTPAGAAV